jgi:hypothetical protein
LQRSFPVSNEKSLKNFNAHEETLREADQAGRNITRIVVAFEAGRDGFWSAHWL